MYVAFAKLAVMSIITGIFTTDAISHAGEDSQFIMESLIASYINDIDHDADGTITLDEFLKNRNHPTFLEIFPESCETILREVYAAANTDGDDQVSLEELFLEL